MDILVEDGRFTQSDICLVDAFNDFIGIGGIDFLDEEATIKEYQKWESKRIENIIPLNKTGIGPQIIPLSQVNRVASIRYLKEMEIGNLNSETDLPDIEEDIYIGDEFNFRDLLIQLWETEGNLFDYQSTVQDYYRQILEGKAKAKQEI